jgi:hypothetical protein
MRHLLLLPVQAAGRMPPVYHQQQLSCAALLMWQRLQHLLLLWL